MITTLPTSPDLTKVLFVDTEPKPRQLLVAAGFPIDTFEKGVRQGTGAKVTKLDASNDRLPGWAEIDAHLVIVGGSATCSTVTHTDPWQSELEAWLAAGVRSGALVVGICYGGQAIAKALGGDVRKDPLGGEYGVVTLGLTGSHDKGLFRGVDRPVRLFTSHNDTIYSVPGGTTIAQDKTGRIHVATAGPHGNALIFQVHLGDIPLAFWAKAAVTREQRLKDRSIWHEGLPREIAEAAVEVDATGDKILRNIIEVFVLNRLRGAGVVQSKP